MTGPRRASSRTILATSRMQSVVSSEEPPNLRIFIARNVAANVTRIATRHKFCRHTCDEFLAIARGEPYHRLMVVAPTASSSAPRLRRVLSCHLRELQDCPVHPSA